MELEHLLLARLEVKREPSKNRWNFNIEATKSHVIYPAIEHEDSCPLFFSWQKIVDEKGESFYLISQCQWSRKENPVSAGIMMATLFEVTNISDAIRDTLLGAYQRLINDQDYIWQCRTRGFLPNPDMGDIWNLEIHLTNRLHNERHDLKVFLPVRKEQAIGGDDYPDTVLEATLTGVTCEDLQNEDCFFALLQRAAEQFSLVGV